MGDNIAQETSFEPANLPAYYADPELPERTDSHQLQQFIDPKEIISAQHVQDSSIWDYQFPPFLGYDAAPLFDLKALEEYNKNQCFNVISRSATKGHRSRRSRRTPVLGDRHLIWNQDHLKQLYSYSLNDDSSFASGQIEQAALQWDCDGGYTQQRVGVPSSAAENYECRNDYSISPGGSLGEALVPSSLLRGYSNQTDRHGYYAPLSFSTTAPRSPRHCPWCHREWKYWGHYSAILIFVVNAFIKCWAWQAACHLQLLRLLIYVSTASYSSPLICGRTRRY